MQIIKKVGIKRIISYGFWSLWQLIFDLLTFSPLRVFWLNLFGAKIGSGTIVDKIDFINLERKGLSGFSTGKNCFLGRGSLYDLAGQLALKDWVTVSPQVKIFTHISVGFASHPLTKRYPPRVRPVLIESGSFLGAGATVLNGVTIGKETMVGANALVNQNIPAKSLAVGVPAKTKNK